MAFRERSISILLSVLFALTGVSQSPLGASALSTAAVSEDEKEIRGQAEQYAKDFEAGHADALANMWAVDGSWTEEDGNVIRGRADIEQTFREMFKRFGNEKMLVEIESLKFPTDNVAVEEGKCTLLHDTIPVSAGRYQVVHVKKDGKWQMLAVTELPCPQPTASLKDLDWMQGRWLATGDNGSIKMFGHWDPLHHFLMYGQTGSDKEPVSVIGWDPLTKQIVTWHFDADGGYGQGVMVRENRDTWVETARGVEPDAKISSAHYIIHKINDDKFTWQSTDRSLAGEKLPDMKELTVTREVPKP